MPVNLREIDNSDFVSALSLPQIAEIEKALGDFHAAQQNLDAARSELRETVRAVACSVEDESVRSKIIGYLYWCVEELKPTWIADAFGVKPNAIHKIAGSAKIPSKICEYCGKPILANSRSDYSAYGSHNECQRAHWRKERAEREAQKNNTAVDAELRKIELQDMPYYDYLETPEWQERRQRALKRAGYRCQTCNAQGILNVHHRTYERRGCELDSDLIVLCRDCHQKFHDIKE